MKSTRGTHVEPYIPLIILNNSKNGTPYFVTETAIYRTTLVCFSATVYAPAIKNKSSAVADMLSERLYERIRQRPPHNCDNVFPTLDAVNDGKLSGSYWVHI